MERRMKIYFVAFFFLLNMFSQRMLSQSIDGTWVGNSEKSFFAVNPIKIVVELQVYDDSLLSGVAHMYLKDGKYEHQKVSGIYRKIDSTLVFSDDSLISYDYKAGWETCRGTYTVKLEVNGSIMRLTGVWKDRKKGIFRCPTVATWFEKPLPTRAIGSSDSSMSVTKNLKTENKEETKAMPRPALERLADIQKVIEIDRLKRTL